MDLHKKVIGNAVVSYFLIFVSLTFLWSKQPYLNHPFVKSHVKVAFLLHILLLGVIFIMSFSFGESIIILEYSLNTIITIVLLLAVFAGILYGSYKAHTGETITLGEMFRHASGEKQFLYQTPTKDLGEEHSLTLIIAHIPFIGYIIAGRHPELPHMRNISMMNMIVTVVCIILGSFESISLASILMLFYVIWSVFQSMRLIFTQEFHSLNTKHIPTPQEKIILQKSLLQYLGNNLKKRTFVPLKELITKNTLARKQKEEILKEKLSKAKASPIPAFIFYIPFINLIGVFFKKTREHIHIKNGFILSFFSLFLIFVFPKTPILLLLIAIPVFYGIGNTANPAYLMPYIYDIWVCVQHTFGKIFSIGKKTRDLHKTDKKVVVKIGEKKSKM